MMLHSKLSSNPAKNYTVATLVSVGKHPKSGRPRRSDQDSKALELALNMDNRSVHVIHAGDSSDPLRQSVLREYLGMGLERIDVTRQNANSDAVPALVERLKMLQADVVLTGSRAESGEGSGMVPYLSAQALGWPMVPAAVEVTAAGDGEFEILQALPRGQRRLLKVRAPFVASVDSAAAESRQTAWASGQRGQLQEMAIGSNPDEVMSQVTVEPARKRPKRIASAKKAKTAADRFKAATAKSASKGGAILVKESAEEKAQVIYDLLVSQGVINKKK